MEWSGPDGIETGKLKENSSSIGYVAESSVPDGIETGDPKESSSSIGFVAATKQALLGTVEGWQLYWTQAVLPAAFALALLYLTVLSFGARLPAVAS